MSWTYTPTKPDFYGGDMFTVEITDDKNMKTTENVEVTFTQDWPETRVSVPSMSFLGESDKGNQVSNTFTWTYVPDQDVSVDAYYADQADDPAPLIIPVAPDNPDASDVTTQAIFDTAHHDSSVSETL